MRRATFQWRVLNWRRAYRWRARSGTHGCWHSVWYGWLALSNERIWLRGARYVRKGWRWRAAWETEAFSARGWGIWLLSISWKETSARLSRLPKRHWQQRARSEILFTK